MKVLNLVYPEKSDIKYKISKFPDGQQNVIIPTKALYDNGLFMYDLTTEESSFNPHWNKKSVQIKSKLNNWLDLELITCAVASLRELGVKEIHLYTPYFCGGRSDRKFEEGGNNYLKQVICPVINSLNFESVTVLDPHSNCLEMGLKNFKKESNLELVKFALMEAFREKYQKRQISQEMHEDFVLVSPDAGASHKIYKLAEQIGYKGDIITCSKDRDTDGKLSKVSVPYVFCKGENYSYNEKVYGKDLIIIDDICDGGATFINIAKEIKSKLPDLNWFKQYNHPIPKIYLIVTHGIFSKGFEELSKYFDGIYCTNSYSDLKFHPSINDIIGPSEKFVKQLNVY